MNLLLIRDMFSKQCTLGKMFVNGVYECETLEDFDRHIETIGVKVDGQTAIPRGKYKVIIDQSNRFKRDLPRLLEVPYFEGIRIHSGNTSGDTEGCILVGSARSGDSVVKSRLAFDAIFNKLEAANRRGEEIFIEVR